MEDSLPPWLTPSGVVDVDTHEDDSWLQSPPSWRSVTPVLALSRSYYNSTSSTCQSNTHHNCCNSKVITILAIHLLSQFKHCPQQHVTSSASAVLTAILRSDTENNTCCYLNIAANILTVMIFADHCNCSLVTMFYCRWLVMTSQTKIHFSKYMCHFKINFFMNLWWWLLKIQ